MYPTYFVVALDSMEYCASLKNLRSLEGKPNWVFVKVGAAESVTPRACCKRGGL
jgi:dTDP-D-glucose 4,6-dehydratase